MKRVTSISSSPSARIRLTLTFDSETLALLRRRVAWPEGVSEFLAGLLREADARQWQSEPAPLATKRYPGRSAFKEVVGLRLPSDAAEILRRRSPGGKDLSRLLSRLIWMDEVRRECLAEKQRGT